MMVLQWGGGKPAWLKGFSRIGLLKDLNFPQNSPHKKPAFTLAEVLITLAIIGVVAALTIPGLINKINSKVVENQKKVMTGKIVQGLNLLNSQENGLTKSYSNSEEFVRALSKYMKMTTICGAGNLKDCFAYDRVNYDNNGEVKSVELSSITTASKLKLDDSFLAPAGFVMGDGTPVIVAWNSKCASGAQDATILDPDQPLKGIPTSCFDGIYDNSGTRNPNMYGKDVLPFGAAKIGNNYLGVEIPGVGYVYVIGQNYSAIDTCNDKTYDNEGTRNDYCANNSWAGAKKACAELGMELPDEGALFRLYDKKSQYPDLILQRDYYWSSEGALWMGRAVNFNNRIESRREKSAHFEVLCIGN